MESIYVCTFFAKVRSLGQTNEEMGPYGQTDSIEVHIKDVYPTPRATDPSSVVVVEVFKKHCCDLYSSNRNCQSHSHTTS